MSKDRVLKKQLDTFNKLILDLENIEVSINDKDQALLLLFSLPKPQDHFKDTLFYGRNSLTFENFQSVLYYKDLNKRKEHKSSFIGEGLFINNFFLRNMTGLRRRMVKVRRSLMVVMILQLGVISVRRRVTPERCAMNA